VELGIPSLKINKKERKKNMQHGIFFSLLFIYKTWFIHRENQSLTSKQAAKSAKAHWNSYQRQASKTLKYKWNAGIAIKRVVMTLTLLAPK
jgi:hypothetical protein